MTLRRSRLLVRFQPGAPFQITKFSPKGVIDCARLPTEKKALGAIPSWDTIFRGLAHLVEQPVYTGKAGGAKPPSPTICLT